MDEPTKLTDEQVDKALVDIFRDVAQTKARIAERSLFGPVQPGSSLAGDDRAAYPHQLSHGVNAAIDIAVDHLDAVRALIIDAKVIHPYAPFTITRAAIEAGSTAVWLLGPLSRPERVVRRCQQVLQDAIDSDTAIREVGLPVRADLRERKAELTDIARRATSKPELILGTVKTTEIIRYADGHVRSPLKTLTAWRVCAGFSHARLWTTLSVLVREELESDDPDVAQLRVTGSLERVLWVLSAAHRVVIAAARLYAQRSTRYH